MRRFVTSLSLIILVFVLISFLSIRALSVRKKMQTKKDVIETYRFSKVEYFPQNRITTTGGFVSLPKFDEEYISYINTSESGNDILISNFEDEEYFCYGSCFCDDEERRSTSIIRKSLTTLVAGFSSVIAYQKAKEQILTECENVELTCSSPSSLISAEIDSCEPLNEESFDSLYFSIEESSSPPDQKTYETPEESQTLEAGFSCEGRCEPREKHRNKPKLLKQINYCKDLLVKGEVSIPILPTTRQEAERYGDHRHGRAISRFLRQFLVPQCRESSTVTSVDPSNPYNHYEIHLCTFSRNVKCKSDNSFYNRIEEIEYQCKGRCEEKKLMSRVKLQEDSEIDCEKLEIEDIVSVTYEDVKKRTDDFISKKGLDQDFAAKFAYTHAKDSFKKNTLTPFCRSMSKVQRLPFRLKSGYLQKSSTISACKVRHTSVECRRTKQSHLTLFSRKKFNQ